MNIHEEKVKTCTLIEPIFVSLLQGEDCAPFHLV